jgi:hypothetical protein
LVYCTESVQDPAFREPHPHLQPVPSGSGDGGPASPGLLVSALSLLHGPGHRQPRATHHLHQGIYTCRKLSTTLKGSFFLWCLTHFCQLRFFGFLLCVLAARSNISRVRNGFILPLVLLLCPHFDLYHHHLTGLEKTIPLCVYNYRTNYSCMCV